MLTRRFCVVWHFSIVELERDAELANTDLNAIPYTLNNTESQELNENCHDNCDANSIGNLKDGGDTNLLGSWKDEANGLSEPVAEASTSGGVASGSPLVQTPVPVYQRQTWHKKMSLRK